MSEPRTEAGDRRRRHTRLLVLLAIGMFGFGFALVPLYGLLCKVTGIQQGGLGAAARQAPVTASAAPSGTGLGLRKIPLKNQRTLPPNPKKAIETCRTMSSSCRCVG